MQDNIDRSPANTNVLQDNGRGPSFRRLNIDSWNIDGLDNKCFDLDLIECLKTFDIICFIETWNKISPILSGYNTFFVLQQELVPMVEQWEA